MIKVLLNVLIVFTLAAASNYVQAVTITHIKGSTTLNNQPKRVVVLGNASLDVLDKIGIQPIGAPHSLLPNYLKKYENSTRNTGTTAEPDFEAIYMLKPDLIIAENRMLTLYDELSEIAPTIMFYVNTGHYWQDSIKNWRMLGKLFNKEETVESYINKVQGRIDKTETLIAKKGLNALVIMSNGKSIAKFDENSRFSLIFNQFKFKPARSKNVASRKGRHGELISFEYIADAKPDTVFILDRQQAIGRSSGRAQTLFNNSLVQTTPAATNNKITFLNSNAWYISSGGITATNLMIDDIVSTMN